MILHLIRFLGIDDVNGPWYAFWSGFGGDLGEFTIAFGVIRGLFKLRKSHEHHSDQLKRHIDYKLSKLISEESNNG